MPQLLLDVVKTLSAELPLRLITIEQYERAVVRFSKHLGHQATIEDLRIENVNLFLVALDTVDKLEPGSVRNYRTSLVRIWNFANDPLNLIESCPAKRIRRPKRPEKRVIAWTKKEVRSLLLAAAELPGKLRCGIPSKDFMKALVWVSYDTGLRPSDTRSLRWCQFDFVKMTVLLNQNKTGALHASSIRSETKRALEVLIQYNFERLFPLEKTGIWKWEQKLYGRAAKYGFKKLPKQGIGTLRKSHATEIYLEHGLAAASITLGHRGSTTTAQRHYVDSSTIKGFLPSSILEGQHA